MCNFLIFTVFLCCALHSEHFEFFSASNIDMKMTCCFMLQILDEVYRILHYIEVTPKLSRPYKVTDELFDLSTMAMEYFKDHIEPLLPEITYFAADFLDFSGTFASEYWQFC